tara:strand:+ start:387 stop:998 length:612 start_codon:yes stop_codon:yes gene_type:complete
MKLSSITYYLKDTGKEEQTVYINIAVGGARIQKSTGIKVKPNEWDISRQRCKLLKGSSAANLISNERLNEFEKEMRIAEKKLLERAGRYDAKGIWSTYQGEDDYSCSKSGNLDLRKVVDYWAYYIDKKETEGKSESTVQAYKSALKMWEEFSVKQNLGGSRVTGDLRFDDLTKNLIRSICFQMLENERYAPKSVKGFLGNLGR